MPRRFDCIRKTIVNIPWVRRTGSVRPVSEQIEQLRRRRHTLVMILTLVTGCADATGFIALGNAFSSVMTGNMVLLGLSAGTADAALAITSGSAIASYALGVLVGSHAAGTKQEGDPIWPAAVTRALLIELSVMAAFGVFWELTLGDRTTGQQLALLLITAAAMGIQSSAIERFGVSGLSSTFLTGTLTRVISGISARHSLSTLLPSVQVLLALVTGACAGAFVVTHIPWLSPVLLVFPLALVVALSTRLRKAEAVS